MQRLYVKCQVKLAFLDPGYIELPFWPKRKTFINIGKEVNAKPVTLSNNAAACEKRGISPNQYKELLALAACPFYTANDSRKGEIVIPKRILQSFINETC